MVEAYYAWIRPVTPLFRQKNGHFDIRCIIFTKNMIFIAKITHVKRISSAVSMGGRKLQNWASVDIWMTPLILCIAPHKQHNTKTALQCIDMGDRRNLDVNTNEYSY